ncbi:MAG: SDR family oxidoreductase [Ilumatobacteraceae bacterium]
MLRTQPPRRRSSTSPPPRRSQLAHLGVRVNCISPGVTATPAVAGLFTIPGAEQAYVSRIPFGRAAAPSEMASAAMFLASDDASYVTGTNLTVDGGWAVYGSADMIAVMAQGSGTGGG